MKFGVFDHVDRGDLPLAKHYENRLRLTEVYDREGFYAYLIAEHHSTPLGIAGSPSVFLSAVAQRTKRLRIGTLVYTLPLVNPPDAPPRVLPSVLVMMSTRSNTPRCSGVPRPPAPRIPVA